MRFYVVRILHIRKKMNPMNSHYSSISLQPIPYGVVWTSFAFVPISYVRPLEKPASRKTSWSNHFLLKNHINEVSSLRSCHITDRTRYTFLLKRSRAPKDVSEYVYCYSTKCSFFFLSSSCLRPFDGVVSRLLVTSVYRSTLNAVWSFKRMCPQRTKYKNIKLCFLTVSSRAAPIEEVVIMTAFIFSSASNRSLKFPDDFTKTPDGIA